MNKQENINKIKESLKSMFSKTMKFEEVTLEDDSIVNVDKLEKDGVATLADGSFPAAGELKLKDGSVLVIGENGIIMEVKPVEVEDATPVEEAQVENAVETPEVETPETPEEENTEDTMVADLMDRVAKLEEAMAALTANTQAMEKTVAEFSAQPADDAATTERKFAKSDKTDIQAELLKLRARNKNK